LGGLNSHLKLTAKSVIMFERSYDEYLLELLHCPSDFERRHELVESKCTGRGRNSACAVTQRQRKSSDWQPFKRRIAHQLDVSVRLIYPLNELLVNDVFELVEYSNTAFATLATFRTSGLAFARVSASLMTSGFTRLIASGKRMTGHK
jgi:hypothetical protein